MKNEMAEGDADIARAKQLQRGIGE
jgi:hypothetical protein